MLSYSVSIEEYHAHPALSNSKIQYFANHGPRGFWARYVCQRWLEEPPTVARRMGSIFEDALCGRDTWVLEPSWATPGEKAWATKNAAKLYGEHVMLPEELVGKTTKAAKEFQAKHADKLIVPPKYEKYRLWCCESEGKMVAPASFADFLEWGLKNFEDNTTAKGLVEACSEQPTLRCDFEGLPGIQARPDWLGHLDSGWVAPDLKTTERLSDFPHSAGKYGYAAQAAIVRYLLARENGTSWHEMEVDQPFIVVEKTWPFRCQVMRLNPDHIALAWSWVQRQLDAIAEHYAAGEWPQSAVDEVNFDLPESTLYRYHGS